MLKEDVHADFGILLSLMKHHIHAPQIGYWETNGSWLYN